MTVDRSQVGGSTQVGGPREPGLTDRLRSIEESLSASLNRLNNIHRQINGFPEEKDRGEDSTPDSLDTLVQRIFSHEQNIAEVVNRIESLL